MNLEAANLHDLIDTCDGGVGLPLERAPLNEDTAGTMSDSRYRPLVVFSFSNFEKSAKIERSFEFLSS